MTSTQGRVTHKENKMKTYEGYTLAELKQKHNATGVVYGKFKGYGDFGVTITTADNNVLFFADDTPMMDRHTKARANQFTGIINNIDYSCEVFVNGQSHGVTKKHRGAKYLSLLSVGASIDREYLTSRRPYTDFIATKSKKAENKNEINKFVHSIIEDGGAHGHAIRNEIRRYAYTNGLNAAKEKYL